MAMTVWRAGAWSLQIVKRSDAAGFEVLPKRWIVERTFAWISRNRRLARDFERYATTVAAFIRLRHNPHMLRRLAANAFAMNPNFPDGLLNVTFNAAIARLLPRSAPRNQPPITFNAVTAAAQRDRLVLGIFCHD